jgi:hypothetical protein
MTRAPFIFWPEMALRPYLFYTELFLDFPREIGDITSQSSFRKGKLRVIVGREGTGPHLASWPSKDSRTVEGICR